MSDVDDAIERAEKDRAKFEQAGVPLWLMDRLTLAAEVVRLRALLERRDPLNDTEELR